MKRIRMLVLALILLCCGTLSASAENRVVINLTRATFNLTEPDKTQVKKVEDAINAYIADKINVEIRLTDLGSDDYGEKVLPALEAGKVNLLWTASWETVVGVNDLVSGNMVYDLTDLLPGTALYPSLAESQWEETRFSGRNYFIPVYKDNVEGYDILFRKDLVDKHGWDISSIRKLADLEPLLADAKADGLKYPFLTQRNAMFHRWYIDRFDFFTADATSSFVAVDRETNQVVNTVLTPEYAEFTRLMGRWAEKGYISPDEAERLTTDTTIMTSDWGISWWTDVPVNSEASNRYGREMVIRTVTDRYAHSTSALGSCYCVTAGSSEAQAKAAIDFMGLLYTDPVLADLYTFGIEGEDFEYTRTERQEISHVTQHSAKYNHSMWESAPATIVTPMDNEPDNKASLYVDFNGGAEISIASGFRFDRAPVAEEYSACQRVFEEYGFALENGGVPEAEVDARILAYQEALDQVGFQTVLAEFQRQYEDWKAALSE